MKPPRKLYRIGEIMRHTGISRQTLHNYTVRGLITEAARTDGNHRLYDEWVFDRLERIQALKERKTLAEIRAFLTNEEGCAGPAPSQSAGAPSGGWTTRG